MMEGGITGVESDSLCEAKDKLKNSMTKREYLRMADRAVQQKRADEDL